MTVCLACEIFHRFPVKQITADANGEWYLFVSPDSLSQKVRESVVILRGGATANTE
jgi:hypothetical protein